MCFRYFVKYLFLFSFAEFLPSTVYLSLLPFLLLYRMCHSSGFNKKGKIRNTYDWIIIKDTTIRGLCQGAKKQQMVVVAYAYLCLGSWREACSTGCVWSCEWHNFSFSFLFFILLQGVRYTPSIVVCSLWLWRNVLSPGYFYRFYRTFANYCWGDFMAFFKGLMAFCYSFFFVTCVRTNWKDISFCCHTFARAWYWSRKIDVTTNYSMTIDIGFLANIHWTM